MQAHTRSPPTETFSQSKRLEEEKLIVARDRAALESAQLRLQKEAAALQKDREEFQQQKILHGEGHGTQVLLRRCDSGPRSPFQCAPLSTPSAVF